MKSALCGFVLLFFLFPAFGQRELLFSEIDTINFSYRTGGKIDSIDLYNAFHLSNLPGGGFNLRGNTFDALQFYKQPGLLNSRSIPDNIPLRTSAFPHLGFTYSFGSKANQFFGVDYTHAFGSNALLNVQILRNSSNGFMRNAAFKNNLLQIDFRRKGDFYSVNLRGYYQNDTTGLNHGVVNDSVIDQFGLIFAPVRSDVAGSRIRQGNLVLENYFNLLKDSAKGFGIYTKHAYDVVNRVYWERDSIYALYPVINIDSFSTRDQHQTASLKNTGGLYLSGKNLTLQGGIYYRYWDYQNLGTHRDTTEIGLDGKLNFRSGSLSLEDELTFNIIGAANEFRNSLKAGYNFKGIGLVGNFILEGLLPEPHQRFYFANNYSYELTEMKLQKRTLLNLRAEYPFGNEQKIGLSFTSLAMFDNYFFIEDRWRNDTLSSVSVNTIKTDASVHYRFVYFQPSLQFNFNTSNFNFVPDYDLRARIFLKGRMFKAKKLETILGVDLAYTSSYNLLSYNSNLDVYMPMNSEVKFQAQPNLSVFAGFAIDVFRLYLRVENISYMFIDAKNQQAVGYPVYPGAIRIGLTWDFFN